MHPLCEKQHDNVHNPRASATYVSRWPRLSPFLTCASSLSIAILLKGVCFRTRLSQIGLVVQARCRYRMRRYSTRSLLSYNSGSQSLFFIFPIGFPSRRRGVEGDYFWVSGRVELGGGRGGWMEMRVDLLGLVDGWSSENGGWVHGRGNDTFA